MKTFKWIGAIAVLLLITQAAEAQTTQSKSFNGIKKIRMTTGSGSCRIKKGTGNAVQAEVSYTFDKESYEPRMEQEGDVLVIRERFERGNNSGNSQWTLTIPDGLTVAYSTGSGDMEIADLTIDLKATTGSGNLIFSQVKGDINGTTGSGDVELANFSGDFSANTGSGNMLVENSTGDISLNCGSGNLRLDNNKAAIAANTGSGNIRVRNLVTQGSCKFNTGSGDALVVLGATPTHDLAVNSGSGDAELDFNGNEIKGEIVMKASKRRGDIVAPFAFDKTEELDGWGDDIVIQKTVTKGNATNRISIGTGSGSAVLKK